MLADTLPQGWLTDAEVTYLQHHATDKTVLEVGTYLGRSTVAMAYTAKQVVTIDHHQGPPQDKAGTTMQRFFENLETFGVGHKVVPIIAGFERVAGLLHGGFGLAFIDGAHDGISVLRDGKLAYPLLEIGAPMLFHDYDVHVGVTSAVHELARRWQRSYRVVEGTSLALIYKG